MSSSRTIVEALREKMEEVKPYIKLKSVDEELSSAWDDSPFVMTQEMQDRILLEEHVKNKFIQADGISRWTFELVTICDQFKELLNRHGIAYTEKNRQEVFLDPQHYQKIMDLVGEPKNRIGSSTDVPMHATRGKRL